MVAKEVKLNDPILHMLIDMSGDWEKEDVCYGYAQNNRTDIEGKRVWLAKDGREIIGYLFGSIKSAENISAVIPDETAYFELEELYVRPAFRSRGIGKTLFDAAENAVRKDGVKYILLSTATKNFRAILHFYIDEVGMDFWSASLFKRI